MSFEVLGGDTLKITNGGQVMYEHIESYVGQFEKIVFSGDATVTTQFIYGKGLPITEIDFGDGNVLIEGASFRYCYSLSKISIGPHTRLSVGNNPFAELHPSLQFAVDPANPNFWLLDSCLYYQDAIVCIPLWVETVVVPENVTRICGLCAITSNQLSSVTFLSTPTWSEHAPFQSTPLLRVMPGVAFDGMLLIAGDYIAWASRDIGPHIVIPEGPTTARFGLFYNCANLVSASFPRSLVSFDSLAFQNCAALKLLVFEGPVNFYGSCFRNSQVETIRLKNTKVTGMQNADLPATLRTIEIPCGASRTSLEGLSVSIVEVCSNHFTKWISAKIKISILSLIFIL